MYKNVQQWVSVGLDGILYVRRENHIYAFNFEVDWKDIANKLITLWRIAALEV
jgi:hypothetical protein